MALEEFSSSDLDILKQILSDVSQIKKDAMTVKQLRKVVPVEDWINDEYYVGKSGAFLYDFWKKEIIDIYGTHKGQYNEVIITGGIGVGKSTAALFMMLRRLYELSCYENVTTMFKLMPNTVLAFIYFSVNQRQAEVTGFGQFRNVVDDIPYFKENFLRDEKINSILRFPENVLMLSGSSTSHAIGMNMIGAILDEANFYQNNAQDASKTEADYSKVAQMYDAIVNRGRSRFMSEGKDESMCILISSNTTTSSFTDHRIKMSAGNPHVKIINCRLWEVKPKGTYSDKTFNVFTGSNQVDPFVVETIEDVYQITDSMQLIRPFSKDIDEAIKELPIQAREKFLQVPVDFKRSFDENVIQALQDIAGYSVAPMGRLFSSRPTYQKACENNPLTHPFTKDEIVISTGDSLKVHDYIRRDWRPFRRDAKRYIHIDQSYANDSTGFASCYRDGFIVDEITGIRKPVVAVEMQLRINPPKMPAQISITKVKDFVIYMRDKIGLNIGKVTYDQFASAQARQELNEVGINADYQSVDKTDEAYLLFCNLLYEGRIKMYYHKTTETELFDLIHFRDKHKVDHPACLVGETCIKLLDGRDLPIEQLVGKKDFWVYGSNIAGQIIPVQVSRVWESGRTREIYEVVLDNGAVVRCTGNHPFLLRDNTYKEAHDLKPGMSLMPLYTKTNKDGYEYLWDNMLMKWDFTHRVVDRYMNGPLPNGYVVHHYNFCKKDNSPGNLERLTLRAHTHRHALLSDFSSRPDLVKKRTENRSRNIKVKAGLPADFPMNPSQYKDFLSRETPEERKERYLKHNNDVVMKKHASDRMVKMNTEGYWATEEGRKRRKELSSTQLAEARKVRMDREDDEWISRFDATKKYRTLTEIVKEYGGSYTAVRRRLNKIGYVVENHRNHKVVEVRRVFLDKEIPVYDMEVPATHNFALSSGIFVHNSSHKDLMDAIVGAVYNCIMDEDESLSVTSYNDVSVTASMFGSGDTDLDDLTNYILYDYS